VEEEEDLQRIKEVDVLAAVETAKRKVLSMKRRRSKIYLIHKDLNQVQRKVRDEGEEDSTVQIHPLQLNLKR